jgi:transcriptional regulator with XRE-family HTH domain
MVVRQMERSTLYRDAIRGRIGKTIRMVRERRGFTLKDCAERCGWSSAKLCRIEGGLQACSVDDLARVATILGCHPESLFA